jgi:cytochrome c
MDVLNNIALPQSTEHFHLLLLVYNIVMVFLLPYLALVVGSIVAANVLDRRAARVKDVHGGMLARRLAGIALPDRTTFVFLAVLPAATVVFLFTQMFQGTTAISAGMAAVGTLFLIAGGVAAFTFKVTFTISDIVVLAGGSREDATTSPQPPDVGIFLAAARTTHRKSGNWAAWLLVIASFCFVGASTIGMNPGNSSSIDSVFAFVLSGDVWVDMVVFVAAAAAMAGAGLLFTRFVWNRSDEPLPAEDAFLRTTAVRLTTAGLLVLPLGMLANVALLPSSALSGLVYVLVALAFGLIALGLHFLYAFVRSGQRIYVSLLLVMIIGALGFQVTKNQVALHIATADHAAALAGAFDRNTEELRASLGVVAKQMTGEDIYNARCSACHLFDQKKIGPPYKDVIVKYAGKKPALIAFVLNPVKVNPAYPNMPAQGLRPSEADSIATYLLGRVVGKSQ